ncbi:hypothetical protein [Reinekea blandensis]|uniref:MFS transporter n=1 Tax=Reinekea blandensis MED297 TaxID=314283 RepID=A4BJQ7_9GAMM|nr:hypothetical protein [Reinekea blandensis]EAR07632.1 hypothetical protein MED297_17522 [Reinekea sp. MED297] [Reinekea blandensis MED297]
MIYEELYRNAAIVYLLGVLGFWLVVWKVGTKIRWRPLRWWLTWLYLCVVLTPWQGTDPEAYIAPVIIVAAFDFLDLGLASALELLQPMIMALVVGTVVIVFAAIALRLRQMKRGQADQADHPEAADAS